MGHVWQPMTRPNVLQSRDAGVTVRQQARPAWPFLSPDRNIRIVAIT